MNNYSDENEVGIEGMKAISEANWPEMQYFSAGISRVKIESISLDKESMKFLCQAAWPQL